MKYNFDEIIERRGTNAMNTDGFRDYIFHADESMTFPYEDDEFVRMWVADMEFATPEVVIDAMRERLDKRIFGYTRIFDDDYYNTFLNWCNKMYDWSFKKASLFSSAGIIPALYELVEYICDPNDKVMITTPSYAFFKYACEHNDIELVTTDLVNHDNYYTMDFEDIERKIKDDKVKLFIFCNPHNPTGRVWKEDELKRFGQLCLDNDVMIISDEIHCDLLRTGQKHIPLAKLFPESDQIITCMAPTKTFNLAGLAFSNIIIPNEDVKAVWNERHLTFENPLSLVAAKAAYAQGSDWLTELKLYLDKNFEYTKAFFDEHLPEVKFQISEATYLAWADVNHYLKDEKELPLWFANKAGVLLEGGDMFVANSDGFIRLNLACPMSVLQEGLKRIHEAIVVNTK